MPLVTAIPRDSNGTILTQFIDTTSTQETTYTYLTTQNGFLIENRSQHPIIFSVGMFYRIQLKPSETWKQDEIQFTTFSVLSEVNSLEFFASARIKQMTDITVFAGTINSLSSQVANTYREINSLSSQLADVEQQKADKAEIKSLDSAKADKAEIKSLDSAKADKSELALKVDATVFQSVLNSLQSGSPKGYFSSLSALNSDLTVDRTKNYIILDGTDTAYYGHWVYHNGDVWVDGGIYQATEIDKEKVLKPVIGTNAIVNSAFLDIQLYGFNAEDRYCIYMLRKNYNSANRVQVIISKCDVNGNYTNDNVNLFLQELAGINEYYITVDSPQYQGGTLLSRGQMIYFKINSDSLEDGLNLLYLTYQMAGISPIYHQSKYTFVELNKKIEVATVENTEFVEKVPSINMFDKTAITVNSEINTSGVIVANASNFGVSDFIPVESGKIVYFSKNRTVINDTTVYYVYYFDENKVYKGRTQLVSTSDGITNAGSWENTNHAFIRLLVNQNNIDFLQVEYDRVTNFVDYVKKYRLSNDFIINDSFKNNIDSYIRKIDKLYNKKLWVDGDSITFGYSAPIDPSTGLRMTYAAIVAENHNMQYTNNAISGSTISTTSDDLNGTIRNPFIKSGRYMQVAPDTDYLTLWFGWNDAHYGNLGSIGQLVETTFYGAYQIALRYYLTNYPSMKIGVVIPYCPNEIPSSHSRPHTGVQIRQAVRDVCEKWGVPYLDLNAHNMSMFYAKENETPYAVTQAKHAAFLSDSVHPNAAGYKYLATMYEDFLRRL